MTRSEIIGFCLLMVGSGATVALGLVAGVMLPRTDPSVGLVAIVGAGVGLVTIAGSIGFAIHRASHRG